MSHSDGGAQGCGARHRGTRRPSRAPAPALARAQTRDLFSRTSSRRILPHGQRLNDAKAHMCMNGTRSTQDGSGNQTPLGGKFTRTCSRGEDCGAF